MRPRFLRLRMAVVGACVVLAAFSGCSAWHGWAHAGSGQPARAGATVTIPLGK
jgi:hypothetical protein